MKKIISFLLFSLATIAVANASGSPRFSFTTAEPSATFDKIWVDYDITEEGQKGMRIHLKFSAYGMKDMDAYIAVYFEYNDEVGGYVKDKNPRAERRLLQVPQPEPRQSLAIPLRASRPESRNVASIRGDSRTCSTSQTKTT